MSEIARLRTVLRFVADHITQRDGFDKPDPVFLRSMIEAALHEQNAADIDLRLVLKEIGRYAQMAADGVPSRGHEGCLRDIAQRAKTAAGD